MQEVVINFNLYPAQKTCSWTSLVSYYTILSFDQIFSQGILIVPCKKNRVRTLETNSFANTDSKFFISIIEQINFLFLDQLHHQKLYINEDCHRKHEVHILIERAVLILLLHDWQTGIVLSTLGYYRFHSYLQLSSCIFHHFVLLVYCLCVMFGTGSGTSSEIPRNIFIDIEHLTLIEVKHKIMLKLS